MLSGPKGARGRGMKKATKKKKEGPLFPGVEDIKVPALTLLPSSTVGLEILGKPKLPSLHSAKSIEGEKIRRRRGTRARYGSIRRTYS